MNDSGAIAQITRARQFLAEAKDLTDIKTVRDMAEAARLYARAAGLGQDAMNEAAEVKLRAERKAGEALAEMAKHKGGRPSKTAYTDDAVSHPPTLAEIGVSDRQSQDWQTAATVPEPIFEDHIAEAKAAGEPLTTAGVVRLARPRPVDEPIEDIDGEQYETLPLVLDAAPLSDRQETVLRAMEDAEHILKEPENERALYALSRVKFWVRLDPAYVADAAAEPQQDAAGYEELAIWVSNVATAIRSRAARLRVVR
jgi:hypothetical protein